VALFSPKGAISPLCSSPESISDQSCVPSRRPDEDEKSSYSEPQNESERARTKILDKRVVALVFRAVNELTNEEPEHVGADSP
jgi:hypothetical protein